MTLVEIILNKYEQKDSDWKYYWDPEKVKNHSITIHQDIYDAIGRNELNEEARRLNSRKDIVFQISWEQYDYDIKKITYRIQDMLYYYKLDGRRPKIECIHELRKELTEKFGNENTCQWIKDCVRDLLRQLEEGVIPKEYCPDSYKEEKKDKNARKNPQKFLQDSKVLDQKKWYLSQN